MPAHIMGEDVAHIEARSIYPTAAPLPIAKAGFYPNPCFLETWSSATRPDFCFLPPKTVKPIVDRAEETHIHDEWTKEQFTTCKYKSSELHPTPKDPKIKAEYEEYKRKRLGK